METVLARAGLWLAILFVAILAIAGAADTGFAIHMGIIACAAAVFAVSAAVGNLRRA